MQMNITHNLYRDLWLVENIVCFKKTDQVTTIKSFSSPFPARIYVIMLKTGERI